MSRSADLNERAEKDIKDAEAGFVKYMDIVTGAVPQRAEIALLKAEGLKVMKEVCGPTIAAARNATTEQDIAASQQLFLSQCQPAFSALTPKFTAETNEIVDAAAKTGEELSAHASSTAATTLVAVILGLIFVLVTGFLAIRSWLVRPIQRISATMNVLANGDLSADVDGTDRRDEVGGMAKAVRVFKENGLRARELEQQAAATRSASEAEQLRVAELERERAQQMAQGDVRPCGGSEAPVEREPDVPTERTLCH